MGSSGAFFVSASQDRRRIAPHVLPLPSLERPALLRRGGADAAQLSTVRALAGFGPGLNLKMTVIADKNHFPHPPVIFSFRQYTTCPPTIQAIVVVSPMCTKYGIHNSSLSICHRKKASWQRLLPPVKTTKAKSLNSLGERPQLWDALPGCFAFQLKGGNDHETKNRPGGLLEIYG